MLPTSTMTMHRVHLQPRCDEPWTEVVYEDSSEGKLTVSASTGATFTAVPVTSTCVYQCSTILKSVWTFPVLAPTCRSLPCA